MTHAALVRRLERFEHLLRDLQRFFNGNRTPLEPIGERVAFDQLEDEELGAVRFREVVNGGDA